MTDIRVRITEQDEQTLFTGKELSLGNLSLTTPCKLLDLNNPPPLSAIELLDQQHLRTVPIVERSRFIHQETYTREANHPDAKFLADSYDALKRVSVLRDKLVVNSLTLSFNPFNVPDSEEYLRSILHIYHGRSDLLLIPNLKVRRFDERQHPEIQVQPEEFTRYVDMAHQILDFRNSKPIFVPVQSKYGLKTFRAFVSDFVSKGYRNFWIDFEGSGITSRTSHIRSFHEIVDSEGLENEVVLYASNVRRENNPHMTDLRSAASDILTAPLGVDIIGVNREPQRGGGGPSQPPDKETWINHKARFLDRDDYSYVKYSGYPRSRELFDKYHVNEALIRLNPKFYANFVNTFEINEELIRHQTIIAENGSLLGYLGTKSSINPKLMKAFEKPFSRDTQSQQSLDRFF